MVIGVTRGMLLKYYRSYVEIGLKYNNDNNTKMLTKFDIKVTIKRPTYSLMTFNNIAGLLLRLIKNTKVCKVDY